MPIEAAVLSRKFIYNGINLGDPNPALNVEQVRDAFTPAHPELANAAIDGPKDEGGVHTYTFVKSVGTKG